ncbi:MAG: hypothetical protein K2M43_01515 [Mycoplasmoidaceae bacterium]|nr:hypothetical protein [Mycoplasmoidaceae bacterium]
MNKKLIKTIASITCGLGIVGTMPLIATSCKKINYFAPYLTLNGGSDESISYADDYVDFIVNEPASKTYKDRSHNGHSASFEVTLGDRTTVKS